MRIAEAIERLAEEVKLLREAVKEEGALLRIALDVPREEPERDKVNKMFTEGLDNLLSYNGGRNE